MEMFKGWNSPQPFRADEVIREAMTKYWSVNQESWHFVHRNERLKDWCVSKTVDKLKKQHSKFSFMD
jgi:hypothetical protein